MDVVESTTLVLDADGENRKRKLEEAEIDVTVEPATKRLDPEGEEGVKAAENGEKLENGKDKLENGGTKEHTEAEAVKNGTPDVEPMNVDAEEKETLNGTDSDQLKKEEKKEVKVAEEEVGTADVIEVPRKFESFEGFELTKVLSNNAEQKRIVVEGIVDGKTAVVILDKKPFAEDIIPELLTAKSKLEHTFQNDIYGSYDCNPTAKASAIKTTVVYPATPKHIEKYVYQPLRLIDETAEVYEKVTLPYLEASSFNIQWVFNILEHKKEAERIVFEDSDAEKGFILLPDLKWDGVAKENLYLVAISHLKGIKSLRDLKAEHLPLLENILNSGCKAIEEKYGLKRSQLRIYIHYQPSYYHFHVHFTALQFNAPGIYAEKSHLLPTVINNIKKNGSYYQEATLPFVLKESDQLYSKLVDYGYKF